jgi:deazaflavin-dependent oxidoreductase (nitroreductase family)
MTDNPSGTGGTDPRVDEALRQMFKRFNRFTLLLWRLGIGPWMGAWPPVTGQFFVLTHTGRKSGLQRRTPLNYALVDGELYCTAGFGAVADWYRNIKANPQVEVWLGNGWWDGVAEEITEPAARLALLRDVLKGSGFASLMAGINPYSLSDAELDAATSGYRVLHIRRTNARTGDGGPDELAWVWPAAAFGLLGLVMALLLRKRCRCCR